MVHQSKDKVFKELIYRNPRQFLQYLGLDYIFIACLPTEYFGFKAQTSRLDILMLVIDKNNKELFLLNIEIQSTFVNISVATRFHEYSSKSFQRYKIPVQNIVLSLIEAKTKEKVYNIIRGEKFTIIIISFKERNADKHLKAIKDKINNKIRLNIFDIFDLIFLQFMHSDNKSQEELYEEACILMNKAEMKHEDYEDLRDIQGWFIDETVKDEKIRKRIEAIFMTKIPRFAQELQEKGRKEGKLEGLEEGKLEGRKEGKLEGRNEGKKEEKFEIANNLVNLKIPMKTISQATGLSTKILETMIVK